MHNLELLIVVFPDFTYEILHIRAGVNLAMARDRVGITQKELAERTNVYQGDISKIERGLSNPSVKTLQRLAEGMGMKIKIDFV